jgi:peptidoglycan/xylan/chitin deacetylase (PgdA/CDA1 family)
MLKDVKSGEAIKMSQTVSGIAKNLFLSTGFYTLLRKKRPDRRIAILRYHAVVEPENNFYSSPPIALSPAEFETHVRYFARHYRIISLDDAVDYVRNGETPPENCVVFTFDDGYLDNLQAAEILAKYNGTGTFYIVTDAIGRKSRFWLAEVTWLILRTDRNTLDISAAGQALHFALGDRSSRWKAIRTLVRLIKSNNREVRTTVMAQLSEQLGTPAELQAVEDLMLNWEQVKYMKSLGMTIGAHTLSHLNLPNADPQDAEQEIRGSKAEIEAQLGVACRHFSYPNSGPYDYFNESIKAMVVAAGFDSACTSGQGFLTRESDLYAIERVRTVPSLAEVAHSLEWERVFA